MRELFKTQRSIFRLGIGDERANGEHAGMINSVNGNDQNRFRFFDHRISQLKFSETRLVLFLVEIGRERILNPENPAF